MRTDERRYPELADPACAARSAAAVGADNDTLFATFYDELHRIARRELARSGPDVATSPTTLLHEAYLDMALRGTLEFPDRPRFLAYAGRAMRGLVIDQVRARGALKRGGEFHITSLDTQVADDVAGPEQLSEISAAIDELAELEPDLAIVVDLKFFAGLDVPEIAALQGLSERTVQRRWQKARMLLYRALGGHA